jgi:hypothetical protein
MWLPSIANPFPFLLNYMKRSFMTNANVCAKKVSWNLAVLLNMLTLASFIIPKKAG